MPVGDLVVVCLMTPAPTLIISKIMLKEVITPFKVILVLLLVIGVLLVVQPMFLFKQKRKSNVRVESGKYSSQIYFSSCCWRFVSHEFLKNVFFLLVLDANTEKILAKKDKKPPQKNSLLITIKKANSQLEYKLSEKILYTEK